MKSYARGWTVFLLLSTLLQAGCTDNEVYQPDGLQRVTVDSLIARAYRFESPRVEAAAIYDQDGKLLSQDALLRITEPDSFAVDYYADSSDRIVALVVRPNPTENEMALRKKFLSAMNEGPELRRVAIDCSRKQELLQRVFDRDQASRRQGVIDRKTDHENLEMITSYLDACGMPWKTEVSEEQLAAIWAVLQHGPLRYRKQYLPVLEAAAERGDLPRGNVAMILDRNLVDEGQPQRYGTQVGPNPRTGEMELKPLSEPEGVDARRAEVGMGPLADYLQHFNITFDVPQREHYRLVH